MARYLAEPLLEQFGLPPDTSHDLLLCALYYRAFISDRAEDSEVSGVFGESPFAAQDKPGFAPIRQPLPQEEMAGTQIG